LACNKGHVVGKNLFKDSFVMMHKNSSFPHWDRPEVWSERHVLLWRGVKNFLGTSWNQKIVSQQHSIKTLLKNRI
jgi:hypothetical protein